MSTCTSIKADIEQRLVSLAASIYSHQNLIAQYTAEKERLEVLLQNLGLDDDGDNDCDQTTTPTTNTMIYSTGTVVNQDGPWQ